MTNLRQAAEMALEALEWSYGGEPMPTKELEAIKAIRQVLAEWTPDDTAYRPDGLRQEELIKMSSDCLMNGMAFMKAGKHIPVDEVINRKEDSDQSPDTTKMIDNVCIRYWVQDTMESGRWATTYSMSRSTAEILLFDECRSAFPQGEIVELPEMPVDSGTWNDVPDATKWVDELRGDESPNSTTDVVEPVAWFQVEQDTDGTNRYIQVAESDKEFYVPLYTAPPKPDLLNQTCCGCGRSGGYALYCGWCWNKGDEPVGYVDQSDLDREGHDFWVSRQPSKNSVPLFIRKANDT